jgi:putative transposase
MYKPVVLQVSEKQRGILAQLARSRTESHQLVARAKLILYIIDSGNVSSLQVKDHFGSSEKWVKQWRKRWSLRQATLAGQEQILSEKAYQQAVRQALCDQTRSGTPPTYSVEQQCRLYQLACQPPADLGYPISHWESKSLRLEMIKQGIVEDISVSTVARFLKKKQT